jgi:uncharacterized HhH-GPD family protein
MTLNAPGQSRICEILIQKGEELLKQPREMHAFTGNPEADHLLNDLENHPHAFVIGCLMDQQIRAEKAWLIPHVMRGRLGFFDIGSLSRLSADDVKQAMTEPEPLHRYREKMPRWCYSAIQRIADDYKGDASLIWSGAPGSATIVRRFREFKGVGQKISTMATNILVRRFKVPVKDKSGIDISADVQVHRVMQRLGLIRSGASKEELICKARELSPPYPGVFDLAAWEIGKKWCRPNSPKCALCYLEEFCPTAARR